MADYPAIIKDEVRKHAAVAQFAGGMPAMCDGVTRGQPGMELSLFSRDVIAVSTAIALTHDLYDGAMMLGVCDKIVPGLLMGGLAFGHLPTIFMPAGPMPSGLSNKKKQTFANDTRRGKWHPANCSKPGWRRITSKAPGRLMAPRIAIRCCWQRWV